VNVALLLVLHMVTHADTAPVQVNMQGKSIAQPASAPHAMLFAQQLFEMQVEQASAPAPHALPLELDALVELLLEPVVPLLEEEAMVPLLEEEAMVPLLEPPWPPVPLVPFPLPQPSSAIMAPKATTVRCMGPPSKSRRSVGVLPRASALDRAVSSSRPAEPWPWPSERCFAGRPSHRAGRPVGEE